MCILDGRFGGDAFTSVSNKGLSVVDYCLVPIEYFSKFANFKVHSMVDNSIRNAFVVAIVSVRRPHRALKSPQIQNVSKF